MIADKPVPNFRVKTGTGSCEEIGLGGRDNAIAEIAENRTLHL
jgi:hypothetical protein